MRKKLASPLSISEIVEKERRANEMKHREANKESQMRNNFIKGLQAILDNAYLMPFEMREIGKCVLRNEN